MTFFYGFMLLFGAGITILLLVQQKKMLREKRIIERHQSGSESQVLTRIDYVALIVKNSRLLTFLDSLDKRLDLKLKIFAGGGGDFAASEGYRGVYSF